jgi:hypothetical protein
MALGRRAAGGLRAARRDQAAAVAPGASPTSASSDAFTPRGSTITGQCASAATSPSSRASAAFTSRSAVDPLRDALPARAERQQAGVDPLGLLVQRACRARAAQLAALEPDALVPELGLDLGERRRAVADEVLVLLRDRVLERVGGQRQERRSGLDGRDDQRRAGQPRGRHAEPDRRSVVRQRRTGAGTRAVSLRTLTEW